MVRKRIIKRLLLGVVIFTLLLPTASVLAEEPKNDTSVVPAGRPTLPAYTHRSPVEIFENYVPWFDDEAKNEKALDLLGINNYGVRPMSDLRISEISTNTKVVIIPSASWDNDLSQIEDETAPTSQAKLKAFVENGGVLVAHLGDNVKDLGYKVPGLLGIADDTPNCTGLTIVSPNHPLVIGPDGKLGTADDLDNDKIDAAKQPRSSAVGTPFSPGNPFCYDNHGSLAGILPTGAKVVLKEEGGEQRPVWAEYDLGKGHVIVTTLTLEYKYHQFQTLVNEIYYALSIRPPIQFSQPDTAACWLTPRQDVPATVSVNLLPGKTADLLLEYRIVKPDNLATKSIYKKIKGVKDGDTFDLTASRFGVTNLWPGVRPADTIVSIFFGAILLDAKTGNPIMERGRTVTYYWIPSVCPGPTP